MRKWAGCTHSLHGMRLIRHAFYRSALMKGQNNEVITFGLTSALKWAISMKAITGGRVCMGGRFSGG